MNANEIIQSLLIGTFTDDEMTRIASAWKSARRYVQFTKAATFRVGEQVQFTARGSLQRGIVTKVNPKNLKVLVGNVKWNVSASLLKKTANG